VFCAAFSFTNAIYIGVPVTVALFGEKAATLSMYVFMANTSLFWTVGMTIIRLSGNEGQGSEKGNKVWTLIKRLLPPATISFIVSVIFLLLGWRLPEFAQDAIDYAGGMVTPLALICSGVLMYKSGIKSLIPDRDSLLVVVGRFIWTPLLAIAVMKIAPIPAELASMEIVHLSMPVMTQVPIVSSAYGADTQFALRSYTLTTAACIISIPLLYTLLQIV